MKKNNKVTKKLAPLFVAGTMLMPIAMSSHAMVIDDYQHHWAKSTIQEWVEKGYIKGVGEQGVLPNKEITRAEFVRMVNMRFGYKESAEINKFDDINISAWYYNDVMYAQKQGYISGVSAREFAPNSPVSREQAATMVARIADVGNDEEYLKVFVDEASFSNYAKGPIGAAAKQKLISGYEDGTFRPKKVLTRAEAMVLLDKAYEISKSEMKENEKEEKKGEFKVIFDSDGGTSVESQIVKKGEKLKKPKDPSKGGRRFLGWFMDGILFDFDTKIEKDIVLKAKWQDIYNSSSSSNSNDYHKKTEGEKVLDEIIGKSNTDDFKINIDGISSNINPEKPITEAVQENLKNIGNKLQKTDDKINKKLEEMQKFYLKDRNRYATKKRFEEKLLTPLRNLGLKDIADRLQAQLNFSEDGYLKTVKPDTSKILIEEITKNADKIAGLNLSELQNVINAIEDPYYSEDGNDLKLVEYEIKLTIGENAPVTIKNSSSRNKMVELLYNFLKETQKPSKEFLSKSHTITMEVNSEIGGVRKVKETITKNISASVQLKQALPKDSDLKNNTEPEKLNIPGVKTEQDVKTLISIKEKLEKEFKIKKEELESGYVNIDINKLKENVDKDAFKPEELELLKKLFGK